MGAATLIILLLANAVAVLCMGASGEVAWQEHNVLVLRVQVVPGGLNGGH